MIVCCAASLTLPQGESAPPPHPPLIKWLIKWRGPPCPRFLRRRGTQRVFCVIPSEAEGPRIFLNASRPTPIPDQSRFLTLATAQWRGPPCPRFSLFVLMPFRAPPDNSPSTSRSPERSRRGRIPDSFFPSPRMGEDRRRGSLCSALFRARLKILLLRLAYRQRACAEAIVRQSSCVSWNCTSLRANKTATVAIRHRSLRSLASSSSPDTRAPSA